MRHARAMGNLSRRIGADAGRPAMPHQHFVDVDGVNRGALKGRARGDGPEFGGVEVLERAAEAANRRPGGAKDHDVVQGHRADNIKRLFKLAGFADPGSTPCPGFAPENMQSITYLCPLVPVFVPLVF